MNTLEQIKKLLNEQKTNNDTFSSARVSDIYPFWNMDFDQSCTVRFLPDNDDDNVLFWHERSLIRLAFQGIVGDDEAKLVNVVVPCAEMYNMKCPVLSTVRSWFIKRGNTNPSKDEIDKDKLARQYWKKRSYIFQGFVVKDGIPETETPESPIRKFVISPSIINIIKSSLLDGELENNPTDYDKGCDFKIAKAQQGQFASYATSNWSRKSRSLNDKERAAIDEYGLSNLSSFLPAQPSLDHLDVIKEMFDASLRGEKYDPEKWSEYYSPYRMKTA